MAKRCNGYKLRVGAMGAGVLRNQIPDTGDRVLEIREYHADQAAPDGKPRTVHDVGPRRGQANVNPKLSLAAAEGSADFGEAVVDIFYPLMGVDDNREEGEKKNPGDLGGDFKTEP